jgi:hypothetical protein
MWKPLYLSLFFEIFVIARISLGVFCQQFAQLLPLMQVSEMALHFCERHGLMVVKCPSKFEIARLCKLTGATSLARFGAPLPEEIGSADRVSVDEIGGQKCTTFNRESQESTKVC